jgi:hypothetical protein
MAPFIDLGAERLTLYSQVADQVILLHQDRQAPDSWSQPAPDLGGAKGARTPDLLVANHIFCVFLRRPMSPSEASNWEDCH